MHKIYRYNIEVPYYFELELPKNAQILSIKVQKSLPQLWVLLDPKELKVTRQFRVVPTGHSMHERTQNLRFVGTFFLDNGALVYHVFEIVEEI